MQIQGRRRSHHNDDTIATKSEGLLLYLHYIVELVVDLDALPKGPPGVYEEQLERVLGPAGLGDENRQTRRVAEAINLLQVPVHAHDEVPDEAPSLSGIPHDTVLKLVYRISLLFPVGDDDRA